MNLNLILILKVNFNKKLYIINIITKFKKISISSHFNSIMKKRYIP